MRARPPRADPLLEALHRLARAVADRKRRDRLERRRRLAVVKGGKR
jgi:hypothetical protein